MTYQHPLRKAGGADLVVSERTASHAAVADIATYQLEHARPSAVSAPHGTAYRRWGKRLLDLTLVSVLILPVAGVCVVLAALVALDGANPFFGHKRVGRNGRSFRCWKLRSMVPDAEARLAAHLQANPEAAAEWAASQKLTKDPRVTRVGRFLRKSSLDELPQIWNVLRGEMSLVGPRPVTEEELDRYGLSKQAYLSLPPGITGPWQVAGRNAVTYDDRVELDIEYSRKLSLWNDLALLFKTVPTVLKLTGR